MKSKLFACLSLFLFVNVQFVIAQPFISPRDTRTLVDLVATAYGISPILVENIISCESSWNPDAVHVNSNGTVDIGLMQINSSHIDDMNSLNLDILNTDDNIQYGVYLISTQGTRPYMASQKCWKNKQQS